MRVGASPTVPELLRELAEESLSLVPGAVKATESWDRLWLPLPPHSDGQLENEGGQEGNLFP